MKKMAAQEGVTEQLKAKDQMLWVQRMNNIRERVTEIVNRDLIYNKKGILFKAGPCAPLFTFLSAINVSDNPEDICFWQLRRVIYKKKTTLPTLT